MKSGLFEEQFKFVYTELDKLIALKTVELDNGAFLSAQATAFDDIFIKESASSGEVEYWTKGQVVNEKVRKSK